MLVKMELYQCAGSVLHEPHTVLAGHQIDLLQDGFYEIFHSPEVLGSHTSGRVDEEYEIGRLSTSCQHKV